MPNNEGRERDLVLAPQQYAFVQDQTKGHINVYVGPTKTSLSNTDQPVRFNFKTKKYEPIPLSEAVIEFPAAAEGFYIVLENPALTSIKDQEHPKNGTSAPPLDFGRKINIPGPNTFPLWPSQIASVVPGHTLRSNQYLVVRVYNEEAARENWSKAVLKRTEAEQKEETKPEAKVSKAPAFVTGQNIIIRGTEYSFFMPPTGLEVVPDEDGNYVRDAVTLERLEYCILINEKGDKRYEKGPQVVFPEPTENFIRRTSQDGSITRRYRAYDLSKLQGIYIQVIADYKDGEVERHAGEELFITGKDTAIYYPRPEHAIIKYGDKEIHNAVAIPAGEGRYVLQRLTGEIRLIKGPAMFLPDPRTEVIVRRILTPQQVELWFPSNQEAKDYNAQLTAMNLSSDVATQQFVSDTAYRTRALKSYAAPAADMEALVSAAVPSFADSVKRGTTFVPPRMITLDTKYEGAVAISPWVGYAIQVVNKRGQRKVITGPTTYLLEYDETLECMALSTGKPKNTDKVEKTVYLRVHNNRVSDIVEVETADMCVVNVKLSYRVNFEGDPDTWFNVDNYVKLLCDHIRSRLKAAVKKYGISDFYQNATVIIRDTILGAQDTESKRKGLVFEENNMHVYDVEVLKVEITDKTIADMLQKSMVNAFQTAIQLNEAQRKLEATVKNEAINQQIAEAQAETRMKSIQIAIDEAVARVQTSIQEFTGQLEVQAKRQELEKAQQDSTNFVHGEELKRLRSRADQDLFLEEQKQRLSVARIQAETDALVKKFESFKGQVSEAMLSNSNNEAMVKIANAMAPMALLGGSNIAEVISRVFENTPLSDVATMLKKKISERA